MKKIIIVGAVLLAFVFPIDLKIGVWDPSEKSPFFIDEKDGPDPYKNYRLNFKRITGFEYSGLHWNQGVVVYINKHVDAYWENYKLYIEQLEEEDRSRKFNFKKYPVGTVLVKENFNLGKGTQKVPISAQTATVMVKREVGYDKEGNDWEYVRFNTKGKVLLDGNSKDPAVKRSCYDCHRNVEARDYVFSTFYKNPVKAE
ncbi:MAG: cytochrome P460 family protein [Spirochaetia bacterium]|nr:cytochrome P460 family protein [Spirochaetia bacterium]